MQQGVAAAANMSITMSQIIDRHRISLLEYDAHNAVLERTWKTRVDGSQLGVSGPGALWEPIFIPSWESTEDRDHLCGGEALADAMSSDERTGWLLALATVRENTKHRAQCEVEAADRHLQELAVRGTWRNMYQEAAGMAAWRAVLDGYAERDPLPTLFYTEAGVQTESPDDPGNAGTRAPRQTVDIGVGGDSPVGEDLTDPGDLVGDKVRLRGRSKDVNAACAALFGVGVSCDKDDGVVVDQPSYKTRLTSWVRLVYGRAAKAETVRRVDLPGDDCDFAIAIRAGQTHHLVSLRLLSRLLCYVTYRERSAEILQACRSRFVQYAKELAMGPELQATLIGGTVAMAMLVTESERKGWSMLGSPEGRSNLSESRRFATGVVHNGDSWCWRPVKWLSYLAIQPGSWLFPVPKGTISREVDSLYHGQFSLSARK